MDREKNKRERKERGKEKKKGGWKRMRRKRGSGAER